MLKLHPNRENKSQRREVLFMPGKRNKRSFQHRAKNDSWTKHPRSSQHPVAVGDYRAIEPTASSSASSSSSYPQESFSTPEPVQLPHYSIPGATPQYWSSYGHSNSLPVQPTYYSQPEETAPPTASPFSQHYGYETSYGIVHSYQQTQPVAPSYLTLEGTTPPSAYSQCSQHHSGSSPDLSHSIQQAPPVQQPPHPMLEVAAPPPTYSHSGSSSILFKTPPAPHCTESPDFSLLKRLG